MQGVYLESVPIHQKLGSGGGGDKRENEEKPTSIYLFRDTVLDNRGWILLGLLKSTETAPNIHPVMLKHLPTCFITQWGSFTGGTNSPALLGCSRLALEVSELTATYLMQLWQISMVGQLVPTVDGISIASKWYISTPTLTPESRLMYPTWILTGISTVTCPEQSS